LSGPEDIPTPLAAYAAGLVNAAERLPSLVVVDSGPPAALARFAERFPSRFTALPTDEFLLVVEEKSRAGGPVFLRVPTSRLLGATYAPLARRLLIPRANVKLVGCSPDATAPEEGAAPPFLDDLGAFRPLPGMTVVVPADAPTVRSATTALAERSGPAYLRLPPADAPVVGDGAFAVGTAPELRNGEDLTIVALGAMVAPALAAADELGRVGVSVRVLDGASVKPFDERAILKAARDTGALLVVEAGPLGTGLGLWVAAVTAENHPVPVRRLGYPDVSPGGDRRAATEETVVSFQRLRDEAWELLRLRGRVP